jgi:hypothetical protein
MDLLYVYYEFLWIFLYGSSLFMNKHEECLCLLLSSEKIMFTCAELYIGSNGSTLTILNNFLQVQRLTRNLEGPPNKNLNMFRDFFTKLSHQS